MTIGMWQTQMDQTILMYSLMASNVGRVKVAETKESDADDNRRYHATYSRLSVRGPEITDPDPQVQRAVIIALRQFLDAPTVAPLVAQQLMRELLDPIVKAELLAITYRLGQLSHLQDLLVMLDQAEDSEVATEILMVLVELTEEKPLVDLKNHQAAIQTVLQQFLLRHPYLQSDVKIAQDNLMRLEEGK